MVNNKKHDKLASTDSVKVYLLVLKDYECRVFSSKELAFSVAKGISPTLEWEYQGNGYFRAEHLDGWIEIHKISVDDTSPMQVDDRVIINVGYDYEGSVVEFFDGEKHVVHNSTISNRKISQLIDRLLLSGFDLVYDKDVYKELRRKRAKRESRIDAIL